MKIFCRVNEYYIENEYVSLTMNKRYLNFQFAINDNFDDFNVYIIFIIDSVEPSNKFDNICRVHVDRIQLVLLFILFQLILWLLFNFLIFEVYIFSGYISNLIL